MQILILSCNTGQGHNSAAAAIKEAFERHGHVCEIHNALLFLSQVDDKVITNGHVFFYRRLPKLFGIGYRYEERHNPKFIYMQMCRGFKKFQAFLQQRNVDAIICTHPFASLLVKEYKRKTGSKILTAFVATDYTCSPGVAESNADVYFIAHPKLIKEFVSNSIDIEKIQPTGIPVSSKFITPINKSVARENLNLPANKKIVLVGCGSMGCGPIVKMSSLLSRRFSNALIIVACGNNARLFERLTRLNHANLIPLSYTKKMAEYLSAADIFISKAGGLSTTEAVFRQVPLLHIDAVPGCETRNIDFMLDNGYSSAAHSIEDVLYSVEEILANPKAASDAISKCRENLPPDPAEAIYSYIESHLNP